jgi:hypothetical protein
VELYSPDCSPSSNITPSSVEHSDDTDKLQHPYTATADAGAGAGVGVSVLSESKRFEADPALFTDPHGSFSTAWEHAQYVLTFNSYMDDLWPALHSQGFTLVTAIAVITSSVNSFSMIVA